MGNSIKTVKQATLHYIMIDDSLISILGGIRPRLQEKCLFVLVLLGVFAISLTIFFSECLFALMLLGVVIAIFLAIFVSICLGVLVFLAVIFVAIFFSEWLGAFVLLGFFAIFLIIFFSWEDNELFVE